jgi:hypothetical protein
MSRRRIAPDAASPLRIFPGHGAFAGTTFRRCVARFRGEHKIKRFSCLDQYLCLAFAQLTWRESLRDIEACLRAQSSKLYHLGFRGAIARNTLANANAAGPGPSLDTLRRSWSMPRAAAEISNILARITRSASLLWSPSTGIGLG